MKGFDIELLFIESTISLYEEFLEKYLEKLILKSLIIFILVLSFSRLFRYKKTH